VLGQVARADDEIGLLGLNGRDEGLDESVVDLTEVRVGDMDDRPQGT
jgi:hypothetical protein